MTRYRSRRRARTGAAQWIGVAIVAALAVVVLVLALVALDRGTGDEHPEGTASTPIEAEPSPSGEPSAEPTPTATPLEPVERAQERFLAEGSEGVLWRAVAGSCAEGIAPVIERSTDGGLTWNDVTPLYRDIRQVAALSPLAGTQAEVVASLGDDCETQLMRTFTQGRFWEPYPDELAAASYIEPADAATVVLGGEPVAAPCAQARSLAAQEGTAALVCDAEVFTWDGADWAAAGIADAVAVTLADSVPVAVTRAPGCGGLQVGSTCTPADPAAPTAASASLLWNADALIPLG
ncbi:hypothetical protein ACIGCK_06185 [Microbacterium sp. NPDC078428]|uniref:hypothetical protein n=1 Tax=Microbacterium sp. NPDC078428 TaxID=3364190 RepID=UPI0037C7958C